MKKYWIRKPLTKSEVAGIKLVALFSIVCLFAGML